MALLSELLLRTSVLYVDCETLRDQEAEPVKRLRVETCLGECVLPVRDTQVHDHEPEVVREGVGDIEPVAREVLEPYLWFLIGASVHESKTSIFNIGVNVKGTNVFMVLFFLFAAFVFVCLSDPREGELFTLNLFDITQFVQVHIAKRNAHVSLCDAPGKAQAIRYLEKSLVIIGQLKWCIFFLPLVNRHLCDSTPFDKVNITYANMVL